VSPARFCGGILWFPCAVAYKTGQFLYIGNSTPVIEPLGIQLRESLMESWSGNLLIFHGRRNVMCPRRLGARVMTSLKTCWKLTEYLHTSNRDSVDDSTIKSILFIIDTEFVLLFQLCLYNSDTVDDLDYINFIQLDRPQGQTLHLRIHFSLPHSKAIKCIHSGF